MIHNLRDVGIILQYLPVFFNIKSQILISPSILLQILKVHTLSSTYIYILFKKGKLYKYVFTSFV